MPPSDDDQPPGGDPNRTVFNPGGGPPSAPPPPPGGGAARHDPTVFMPSTPPAGGAAEPGWSGDASPAAASAPPASPVWDAVMPEPAPYAAPPPPASANAGEGRIAPGVVLNHIYEVRKFIARGGMGEVYEGINVQTDERVAIKVILSHLAMDPSVQAMFRKEARTLTRLSHPGLVQYRVLAQEPALGVLYIVTDFIDGGQLSDYYGQIHPGADELESLLRRLAAGLAAAHELGAIHRDISPDNVLLPEGRLDQAKIIDFGIAKDLDASSKTIVGDGFAGKLGFVAPEQFGDYDRQIGPWTDVYSLALVILTAAAGQPVDMGSTLVDAIDKRRKGPDLSVVPERIRPVLEGMLKPDPAERYRSMADVLLALDKVAHGAPPPPPKALDTPAAGAGKGPQGGKPAAAGAKKSNLPMIAAGVGAVVVLGGIGAVVALSGGKKAPAPAPTAAAGGAAATEGAGDTARASETVRKAVEASLAGVSCTWLDIDSASDDGAGGVSLRLSGVAGSPVAAQAAVQKVAAGTGAKVGLIDTSNVFPVAPATCAALDTMRQFREPASDVGRRIATQQSNWELMKEAPPCNGPNAKVVVDVKTDPAQDFSILGFDRKGGLQQIFADRAALEAVKTQAPDLVTDKGAGAYSTTACYNETGLVGEVLLTGKGPFPVDLPNALKTDQSKVVDAAWLKAFADKARAGAWKTSMVWYRVVNDQT